MENESIKEWLRSKSKSDGKDFNMAGSTSTPGSSAKKDKNSEEITTETIWNVLQQLVSTVNGIQNQLSLATSAKGNIDSDKLITTRLDQTDQTLMQVVAKLNLVGNMLIGQEEKIEAIESGIKMEKKFKSRPNLVVRGILEAESESPVDCKTKADKFFTDQMEFKEDEIKVKKAYWLGAMTNSDRPVLVKLQNPSDKTTIFKSLSKLKGKSNAKRKLYFMDDDNDPEQAEVKQYLRDLKKENDQETAEENKLILKMYRVRIMANNDTVKQLLKPPTDARVLSMTEDKMAEIKAVKLIKGEEFIEKKSEYTSYVQKVQSIKDVDLQKGLYKMRVKFADVTHISCAYRL